MIETATAWLPPATPAPAALARKLETLIDDWSRAWVAGRAFRASEIMPAAVRIGSRATGHLDSRGIGARVTLQIGDDARRRLGLAALGVDLEIAELNGADLDLAELLAADMLSDFERRFALFARLPATAWDGAGALPHHEQDLLMSEIGDAPGAALFRLLLSPALFAELARGALPAVRPGPLGQGPEALARTPVSVSALLGRSTVALSDLEMLAAGDVVVLDRAAGAPLPLAIDGVELPQGRCRVTEIDGRIALEMTLAITGAAA